MKLSGHTYDNDIFNQLINNIKNDNMVKTAKQVDNAPISGADLFSNTTQNSMDQVMKDELQVIAAELSFAAGKAHVALTTEDLFKFANDSRGLRGKKLERAAQKYCNNLSRDVAEPMQNTRISDDGSISRLAQHSIVPAGYPQDGPGDSMTGKFMGCSKNPNSIFDTNALTAFAAKPNSRDSMLGDEQIKDSYNKNTEFKKAQKDEFWQSKQTEQENSSIIRNNIASVHSNNESGSNPKLASNTMSIFSNDRDFSNISAKTAGEMLKSAAVEKKEKTKEANSKSNEIKSPAKADNSLSGLFITTPAKKELNVQRAAIDKLFEGLTSQNK